MQRLISSLLVVLVLVNSVFAAGDWDPESDGDKCHGGTLLTNLFGFTEEHCHYTEETLRRFAKEREEARAQKEAEEARERERLRRDRERLRNGLGIGLFCLGIFYILKRGTEDEKEDNKRFTLSAYNSPNSPSFPLSDAVQGININFSIPLKLF